MEISEASLPLCFSSFQFSREKFKAIKLGIDIDNKEDNENLNQDSSVSQVQLENSIETSDQMTQESFIPLCFESF